MPSTGVKVLSPKKQIELYSGTYFGACALGGIIGKNGDTQFLGPGLSLPVSINANIPSSPQPVAQPTP
jgi:hypothetical protein